MEHYDDRIHRQPEACRKLFVKCATDLSFDFEEHKLPDEPDAAGVMCVARVRHLRRKVERSRIEHEMECNGIVMTSRVKEFMEAGWLPGKRDGEDKDDSNDDD
jgi:hypothetical protein